MKNLFLSAGVVCVLFAPFGMGEARAADIKSFDIVGIKAGMKPDEVKAAIEKHNPEMKINERHRNYIYSDGVLQQETDPVLSRMAVMHNKITSPSTAENETIVVDFVGIPGEEVVTAVKRTRAGDLNPPSVKNFAQILLSKYGAASATQGNRFTWYGDKGTQDCFDASSLSEISNPLAESGTAYGMEDFSACRSSMVFWMTSSQIVQDMESDLPVTGYTTYMVDADLLVEKDTQLQNWLENVQEEATAKRAANVEAPKL